MEIYVVKQGDTIFSVATAFGIPMSQLLNDNRLPDPTALVAGQTLVIRFPDVVHTVQPGETLLSIGDLYGLTQRQLYRNNPALNGDDVIYPGQTLVISYRQEEKLGTISVSGYAYPFINMALLQGIVPFLTGLTPFTYGLNEDGSLLELNDAALIAMAKSGGAEPIMHLSTLTESGNFSSELAHQILNDSAAQARLVENIITTMQAKGYSALDVDFEFLPAADAQAYANFISTLRARLQPLGYYVIVALAPKTSADQPGLLYEGHNYKLLGAAADQVLLMTYEWGYTYGPPMAVAPLPNVRRVVEYAITEIPPEKIWLGMPNYGYDWPLPFVQGQTMAISISNQYAVSLARRYNAVIQYDMASRAPWFRYTDERGIEHEVWFEDARSIREKLALIPEYGLLGAGYWNLMRPFPQNWLVLDSLYDIRTT